MQTMPAADRLFKIPQLELALAIDQGNNDLVRTLASKLKSSELDAYGNQGVTLLIYAAYKAIPESDRQLAIVTTLLRAGADPLKKSDDSNGGSVLSMALLRATGGKGPAFLAAILNAGVSPDSLEYHGSKTPILLSVASQTTPDSLRLLVESGANVNIRNGIGRTAIMDALSVFALDEVNYLLDHGADPKAVDLRGNSFARRLEEMVNTQQNDPLKRYPKVLALRDRVLRMGVEWPPASALVERDRMRSRGITPITPYGLDR